MEVVSSLVSWADAVGFHAKRYAFFSCRQKNYKEFPWIIFWCFVLFFLKEDYSGCCVEVDDWSEKRLEVCKSVGKRGGKLTLSHSLP